MKNWFRSLSRLNLSDSSKNALIAFFALAFIMLPISGLLALAIETKFPGRFVIAIIELLRIEFEGSPPADSK